MVDPALSPLGRAALWYAQHLRTGVFMLAPRSKLPLIPKRRGGQGVLDASRDPHQIAAWWRKHPTANLALACGAGSGLVVLDVDAHHDGIASFDYLRAVHGELPPTPTADTGRGGFHFYFSDPTGTVRSSSGKLAPGLDIRGDGGSVTAPPSVHENGKPYRWRPDRRPDDMPLAELPAWIVEAVKPPPPQPIVPRQPVQKGDGQAAAYGAAALERAARAIEQAPPGTQHDTLRDESYSIGGLIPDGYVVESEARAHLIAAGLRMACGDARRPWTRQTVERTVAESLKAGAGRPRDVRLRA
jgi:hypothetical protein